MQRPATESPSLGERKADGRSASEPGPFAGRASNHAVAQVLRRPPLRCIQPMAPATGRLRSSAGAGAPSPSGFNSLRQPRCRRSRSTI